MCVTACALAAGSLSTAAMKAIRRRFLDFFGVGTDDQTDSRPSSVRFKCTAQQVHSLRLGRSLMGTMYTGNEHEDESKVQFECFSNAC